MASNSALAFGTVAKVFGDRLMEKQDQKHREDVDRQRLINGLVMNGIENNVFKDPNEAFGFLISGGKPGKAKIPPQVQNLIGGMQKASQQAGSQPATPSPHGGFDAPGGGPAAPQGEENGLPRLLTAQERAQQSEDSEIAYRKRLSKEVTIPEREAESEFKVKENEARFGYVDKATLDRAKQLASAAGDDPANFPNYLQKAGQAILDEKAQKANASKYPAAMRERIAELVARGIPEDRAPAVASAQMDAERKTKMVQASERLTASLAASRASLAASGERLAEMKTLFPLTIAAKQAGLTIAQLRPDVVKAQLAKLQAGTPGGKADAAAAKEADRIVQAATKLASSREAKQSWIAEHILGIDDDEATIRRKLIEELSGGQDADAVEALARQASSIQTPPPSAAPPAKPAAPANPFR